MLYCLWLSRTPTTWHSLNRYKRFVTKRFAFSVVKLPLIFTMLGSAKRETHSQSWNYYVNCIYLSSHIMYRLNLDCLMMDYHMHFYFLQGNNVLSSRYLTDVWSSKEFVYWFCMKLIQIYDMYRNNLVINYVYKWASAHNVKT